VYTQINKTLGEINKKIVDLETAERAGLDVAALRDQLDEVEEKLKRIKSVYFSDKP
jgi:tetrahydromethanopterin S-methyltransferase subunit G